MTAFLVPLLLKILMAATIVVAASVMVARSGPFIGSLVASLPTAGGAALIILALEHPPSFVAQSMIGLGLGLLTVYLLAEALGVWWAYGLGLCVGLGWNVMLWLLRQRRR